MSAKIALAPDDPVAIVEEYLRLHMIPDPDSARAYCAPSLEIRFTGNRLMHDPAEATAFNKRLLPVPIDPSRRTHAPEPFRFASK